jgi:hypothetical protein
METKDHGHAVIISENGLVAAAGGYSEGLTQADAVARVDELLAQGKRAWAIHMVGNQLSVVYDPCGNAAHGRE